MKGIKEGVKELLKVNVNERQRGVWLAKTLGELPSGLRILDAGAGELRNKPLCAHFDYVSQDVCQYEGSGDAKGLQTGVWDTSRIDIICDIVDIPEPSSSFDVILCSEVFEHLPDATKALDEFARLLKPGGRLITTAPFASLVHFAPYHYATGFSRYWYEYHLPNKGFDISELTANGDWFAYARQEVMRLPSMARREKDWCWPLAYLTSGLSLLYFVLRGNRHESDDVACFGWHCVAIKR
ncbi:Demethylrebeccamycin-D-glucose O-methyltransferase [Ferriphaselus amnicola]|uniref:Demethylrebeccamycin-D-glucose O-methyltransferase n=1 Tax=Ferriphaselus amnicola TaxID=1188319 RepID=A0A2Z6G8I0_9PROT|nr:class I SAM-dependent methyltransferase [Ferriphaselus amnicola]BBE49693.1 Demethylrebeccamycin-D-glucose O-methyltransferase [Ferriphaselus amnicola]